MKAYSIETNFDTGEKFIVDDFIARTASAL